MDTSTNGILSAKQQLKEKLDLTCQQKYNTTLSTVIAYVEKHKQLSWALYIFNGYAKVSPDNLVCNTDYKSRGITDEVIDIIDNIKTISDVISNLSRRIKNICENELLCLYKDPDFRADFIHFSNLED